MKHLLAVWRSFVWIFVIAFAQHATAIDLERDNPDTLIGTKSASYTIGGFRLGLTQEQVWKMLDNNTKFLGVPNTATPTFAQVFLRSADGAKGNHVMNIVWDPNSKEVNRIVVFQPFSDYLSPNFRQLLTFAAVDENSEFKRRFIGPTNTPKVKPASSTGPETITYSYESIGVEIFVFKASYGTMVRFAIVPAKL